MADPQTDRVEPLGVQDSDDIDDMALVPPTRLRVAAGALALTGLLTLMLGGQLIMGSGGQSTYLTAFIVAYFAIGIGAIADSVFVARGSMPGTIAGIVLTVLITTSVWAPLKLGIFSCTTPLASVFGFASIVMLGIGIPACKRLSEARRSLADI